MNGLQVCAGDVGMPSYIKPAKVFVIAGEFGKTLAKEWL
jgi:hypothetical protein